MNFFLINKNKKKLKLAIIPLFLGVTACFSMDNGAEENIEDMDGVDIMLVEACEHLQLNEVVEGGEQQDILSARIKEMKLDVKTELKDINFSMRQDLFEKKEKLENAQKESKYFSKQYLPISLEEQILPVPSEPEDSAQSFYRFFRDEDVRYASILSLDGGGFRGYMEAIWLDYLERKMNRKIHEVFNFVAGTSIGGILSMAATIRGADEKTPLLSTREMLDLFENEGDSIFPKNKRYPLNFLGKIYDKARQIIHRRYSARPLENLLRLRFGSTRLNSTLTNVIVTSAVASTHEPYLFKSFHEKSQDYMAWEIGRATSAAPTYFRSFPLVIDHSGGSQHLVDGGLWYNNPARLAYESTIAWAREKGQIVLPENMMMLSLGTGIMPIEHIQPQDAGLLTAAASVIESMMTISSKGVHLGMQSILPSENYKRINPNFEEIIDLDATDPHTILTLRQAAEHELDNIDHFITDDRLRLVLESHDR